MVDHIVQFILKNFTFYQPRDLENDIVSNIISFTVKSFFSSEKSSFYEYFNTRKETSSAGLIKR